MRLLFILLLAIPASVRADIPYGAQGLAHLAEQSTLVITSSSARRLADPHSEVAAYSVRVAGTIHGTAPSATLMVLSERTDAFDAPDTSLFRNAIVFLKGPLSPADRAEWNVKTDPVYLLTSAHFSVRRRTDSRMREVREYLGLIASANSESAELSWAEHALSSSDPFLQESAVLLASDLIVDQPAAADLLARASTDDRLSLTLREESIEILGSAGTVQAFAALQRVAVSPNLPPTLRRLAERTFINQYHMAHRP